MRPKLKLISDTEKKKRYVKAAENLWLNTESGYYYVRKRFRRYHIPDLFESTKETTIGRAKSKSDQLIAQHLSKYLGSKGDTFSERRSGHSFSALVDEIMSHVAPMKRPRTQEGYRHILGELKEEWGRHDVSNITLAAWQNWLITFRRKKDRKTFSDYKKYMNLALRYAYTQRYVSHLLILPHPDPVTVSPGRVFTHDEISRLYQAMNEDTRDQFILSYECFMRLREVLYLTWDRVDLKARTITLRAGDVKTGSKTGRGRTFRMSSHAYERLVTRMKRSGNSSYVFPSPEDDTKPIHQNKTAWINAKRRSGLTGRARWHDLRHTAITHALFDSKIEPLLVSEYAGVSMQTLQRVYLHSTHEKTAAVSHALSVSFKKRGEKGVKSKRGVKKHAKSS